MEILLEKSISPLHMRVGDTLNVTYTDSNGKSHILDAIPFESARTIDRIVMVRVGEEFGFVDGIGALLGKSK